VESIETGCFARIKKKGPWFGALVGVTEKVQEEPPVYQVEVLYNSLVAFFSEDDLSRVKVTICDLCGDILGDNTPMAMIAHKGKTGHSLYTEM